MRQWRVGTISMGASLVLLGVILSVAQFKNWDVATIFLSWWPFILIVLGMEILIYLFVSKQESALIKYDFLSVIFIGLLGTVALSFMLLTVSGLLDEIRYSVSSNEETFDLPSYTETLPSHIEKIVLDTDDQPIRLEGSNGHAVQVFGTYRTSRSDETNPIINKKEDFISLNESGNTLYVKIKKLPEKRGIFNEQPSAEMVVLIPVDVTLELRGDGGYQTVTIRPGNLLTDWFVEEAGHLNIQLQEESDVKVEAIFQSTVFNEKENSEKRISQEKVWKTGAGTHQLNVTSSNSDNVNVTIQGKIVEGS